MASSLSAFQAGSKFKKFARAAVVGASVLGFSSSIVVATAPTAAYAGNMLKKESTAQCAGDAKCLATVKSINRKIDTIRNSEAAIGAARAKGAAADAHIACISAVEKAMESAGGTDYVLGLPKDHPVRVSLRAQRDACGSVPSGT